MRQKGADLVAVQPAIKVRIVGSHVFIEWGWEGIYGFVDQLEIQVDRGDGQGWRVLTFDTTPNYTDTAPHPAAPTRWKYRAIWRVDDQQAGVWSAEVSVMAG